MFNIHRLQNGKAKAGLILLGLTLCLLIWTGCGAARGEEDAPRERAAADEAPGTERSGEEPGLMNRAIEKEIYLAGGCFWGMEGYFRQLKGVVSCEVGYANGREGETSYYELAASDHAETLKIRYDAARVHLAELLAHYFRVVDPTSLNRQGNDRGRQYRSGIYYTEEEQKRVAEEALRLVQKRYTQPLVVELEALRNYVRAEDYHQDYLTKNPGGYCHIDLAAARRPLYPVYSKPEDAALRERLDALSYAVTQEGETERPYSSPYDKFSEAGIYVDAVSGQPLFSSDDKYDAGCGWPSFTMPITSEALSYFEDLSHGMKRLEVKSGDADSHLGHVFPDGPAESGGLRYCINGASLRFVPRAEMEAQGYGDYLPYVVRGLD